MNRKIDNVAWVILYSLVAFAALWTTLQLADDVELYANPVVSDFKVNTMTRAPGVVILYGSMNRLRPQCQTRELTFNRLLANGSKKLAILDFSKDGGKKILTRSPGIQEWGPWVVSIPDEEVYLSVKVRHSCNPLYDLETELLTFMVPK